MVLRRVFWLWEVLAWLDMGYIDYFGKYLDHLDYSENGSLHKGEELLERKGGMACTPLNTWIRCYRRTMTSMFVIPFTPLYIPPLPDPIPSATPVPVTRNPPTVTPLANHP